MSHLSRYSGTNRLRRIRLVGATTTIAVAVALAGAADASAAAPKAPAVGTAAAPPAPVSTAASYDRTTSKAKVTWAKGDSRKVAGYRLYRKTRGASNASYAVVSGKSPLTTTSYTDKPPATGTAYAYAVRAVGKNGQESAYSAEATVTTVDRTTPTAPTALVATPGSKANALSWKPVAGAARYEVYRASEETGETGPFTRIATPKTTSYADSDADADVPYAYKVRALDTAGNASPYSKVARATRDTTAPLSPHELTVAKEDERGVTLTWRGGGSDAVKYTVYRSTSPYNSPLTKVGSTATLTYRDTSGETGRPYTYVVKGVDAAGNESRESSWVSATKLVGPSSVPQSPQIHTARVTGDRLLLEWSQSSYVPVSRYHVYRSTNASVDTTDPANEVAVTQEKSLKLTVGQGDYYYVVVAESGYGVRSAASTSVLPEVRVPQPPPTTSFYDVRAGDGRITLDWYSPPQEVGSPPVVGFRLYRSTSPGVTKENAETSFNASGNSHTDTGLSNGTTYYYVISTIDGTGAESALSPEVSATPAAR
ncbi:fibronectin type III domain-containing protein [Streptomyces zagrosensis]|uniref:Fibronectin type 3 domain-containing protein n=1 Tax=Streptomyces zagrosensis TaxID=1042984 RepID=A0A7W9QH13_9ACTN|nr:hypothetical protein [Streptomyces zagrosensis]MBB5940136.1 fibronectin type 3 domain-containing protein [Streptomyces zagrosensis]